MNCSAGLNFFFCKFSAFTLEFQKFFSQRIRTMNQNSIVLVFFINFDKEIPSFIKIEEDMLKTTIFFVCLISNVNVNTKKKNWLSQIEIWCLDGRTIWVNLGTNLMSYFGLIVERMNFWSAILPIKVNQLNFHIKLLWIYLQHEHSKLVPEDS